MKEKNKIKVLLVYPDASHPQSGGISRWMRTVLDYYDELKCDDSIELIHCKNEKHKGSLNKNIVNRLIRGVVNYIRFYKILKKRILSEKYDIAHICTSASLGLIRDLIFVKLLNRHNISVVIHFHCGRIPEIIKAEKYECILLRRVLSKVCHIIVIDMASYNVLKSQGYNNITYLPNMLSPFVQQAIESSDKIQRDERLILFAGHVVPTKGVYELVDACAQLKDIRLRIMGPINEDIREKLMIHAKCDDKDWVEITGKQDNIAVIRSMLSCGVFVLPTYTEGFPNVIIESMACACPIVTTPVGAIPEMLDILNVGNECGICVEPRNVEQLRNAIKIMLDDREYAQNCGKRAQQRVNELYSIEPIWEKMVTIWKNIAG